MWEEWERFLNPSMLQLYDMYLKPSLPPSLSLLWIVTCGADVSSQPSVSMDECQGNQIWFKWVSLPVCPLTLHAHIRQHKEPAAIIYLGNTWTCAYVNGQHVGWAEKFSTEMTSWMGTQSNHTVTNCPPLSLQGHANFISWVICVQSFSLPEWIIVCLVQNVSEVDLSRLQLNSHKCLKGCLNSLHPLF